MRTNWNIFVIEQVIEIVMISWSCCSLNSLMEIIVPNNVSIVLYNTDIFNIWMWDKLITHQITYEVTSPNIIEGKRFPSNTRQGDALRMDEVNFM